MLRISAIKEWIKSHKLEFLILTLTLLLGAFLRLYRIDEYMTFLGDEGRDAIIVRRFLTQGDLMFVGPGTSIGNMYLGPLYYYMMAPALLLANFSPVGPAVMVALLNTITIFLVWYVARKWFPSQGRAQINIPALTGAFLYAISTTVVIFSRSSWNPNIMPFFALLSIYSIWKVYKERKYTWLIVLGLSFAFVLQSHYLGLLLMPPLFIFYILTMRDFVSFRNLNLDFANKPDLRKLLQQTTVGLLLFLVLMSPLVAFDFRHDFRNFRGMMEFITGSKENYSPSLESTLSKILPMSKSVITRLLAARDKTLGMPLSLVLLIGGFIALLKKKNNEILLLLTWLLFGSVGLALLRQEVYDHYFGFLYPVPFLLLAAILSKIKDIQFQKLFSALSVIILTLAVIKESPIKDTPDRQLARSIIIAEKIAEEAKGERFNLATISETTNRDTYQYWLELWGEPVVDTDQLNPKFTVTDQLFVVCDKPRELCNPTHDPSAWITNFGWSIITDSWEIDGRTIFKLAHSEQWLRMRDNNEL